MAKLRDLYPQSIKDRYGFEAEAGLTGGAMLELAAKRRGFLISGGELDTERMANVLLDEFRGGILGKISLDDLPEKQ